MNTYNLDKMYESYSSEVERMQKCIDELQQENEQLKEVIDKLEKKIKVVREYGFDIVGRYELLDILKEAKE